VVSKGTKRFNFCKNHNPSCSTNTETPALQIYFSLQAHNYPHVPLPTLLYATVLSYKIPSLKVIQAKRGQEILILEQVLSHCATSRRVSGSIPSGVAFFPKLPMEPRALWSTQPLKMSTRKTPGGKGGRCVRVTTLPPS
jgi:hypothetical protein